MIIFQYIYIQFYTINIYHFTRNYLKIELKIIQQI